LAFTRNPATGLPATYEGTAAVDTLILADEASEITINGLGDDDIIVVSARALAANALSSYKIYGNDGDDAISITAAQLSASTVQGGSGDDAITFSAGANLVGSVARGGADDDAIFVSSLNSSTVNGNLGTDTITVTGNAFSSRVYGGSDNDTINIDARIARDTRFNGSKGGDTLIVSRFADISNSSVFGGEGNDRLTVAAGNASTLYLSGDKGNDTITAAAVTVGGSVFGGEGDDVINVNGTAAADSFLVIGGTGADDITVGVGTDTIEFNRGDSLAATTAAFAGANLAVTDTVTFGNSVDLITGFTTGTDELQIDFNAPAAITAFGAGTALSTRMATTGIIEFSGTRVGNTFTFDGTNTDFLYVIGGGNQEISIGLQSSTNIFISDTQLAIGDFT